MALKSISGPDNPNLKANVVFVRGLTGNQNDTWQNESPTDNFWPNWLGVDFPVLGIWMLGYQADMTKWKQETMILKD